MFINNFFTYFVVVAILFYGCKNHGNKIEKSKIVTYDSIKGLSFYEKGLKYYDDYSFTNESKLLDSVVFFMKKSLLYNNKKTASYELLTTVFSEKEDYENLDKLLGEALKHTNQKSYYLAKKGYVKKKIKQKDSAQYYFDKALEGYYKKSQNLGIKNQIISILYQMGDIQKSLSVLDECIREYPRDSVYLKGLKTMISNERIPR